DEIAPAYTDVGGAQSAARLPAGLAAPRTRVHPVPSPPVHTPGSLTRPHRSPRTPRDAAGPSSPAVPPAPPDPASYPTRRCPDLVVRCRQRPHHHYLHHRHRWAVPGVNAPTNARTTSAGKPQRRPVNAPPRPPAP